jgi:hypothetical protein
VDNGHFGYIKILKKQKKNWSGGGGLQVPLIQEPTDCKKQNVAQMQRISYVYNFQQWWRVETKVILWNMAWLTTLATFKNATQRNMFTAFLGGTSLLYSTY